jgi:hypothetical protein
MKTTQSLGTGPVHQTGAGSLEITSEGKAMAIAYTDQQITDKKDL